MIISSILSLLLSNAVVSRRDISIFFNQGALLALIYCITLEICSILILNKGLGLHGGLLHITNITQTFHIFIFFISIIILQLTSFYPRILQISNYYWLKDLIKIISAFFFNKLREHMKIVEYPLILLFIVSGAVLLISTSDLVSIFLSIELQSYGLYLLSSIYRNSELSTTGGLIYFLLGGLSSCFILLGTSLLYANSGTTSLEGFYIINSISDLNSDYISWYNSYYLNFSLLIFSIGFLFKVSAAPFHLWSPKKGLGKSLSTNVGSKLPNSGEPLKLLVLNHIWKYMSGWTNYSGIVISQKMSENEMGYRGSKSVIHSTKSIIVKEQRVNGSWCGINLPHLRCTLLDFERSYQVKIPSNQIIQRQLYSTVSNLDNSKLPLYPWFISGFSDAEGCFLVLIRKSSKNLLPVGTQLNYFSTLTDTNLRGELGQTSNNKFLMNPWFVTGFTDGEGCFWIDVYKDKGYKTGWRVKLFYQINLHIKDQALLEQIQKYFNAGKIYNGPTNSRYYVSSLTDLEIIIKHFDRYPLITQKQADFELLKQAFILLQNKEHLTPEGLEKIIAIKASINNGLSDDLKVAFPKINPVDRPVASNTVVQDPNWLAGFASAEGCFLIRMYKAKTSLGMAVKLVFQLTQHARDEQLMRSFIDYFNCGTICKSRESFVYRVEKFSDIQNKIIPFFNKYQIQGVKQQDYLDFCKAAEEIENKNHLTKGGLSQIKEIKTGMNKGRSRRE